MKPHHFLLFLFLTSISIQPTSQLFPCMTTPLTSKYSSKSICGTPTVIEKDSSVFPSELKTSSYQQLSMDFEFSILQTCSSGGRTRFDLLTLTISPDHVNDKTLYEIYLDTQSGTDTWVSKAFDGSSEINMNNMAVPNSLDPDFTYALLSTMDLSTGQISVLLDFPGVVNSHGTAITPQTSYQFDQYTKIFLCSDSQSNPTAYCQIYTFAMWYTSASSTWNSFQAGLTPVPIATYIFNELSGYSAADSTKKLGTAYFGLSSASNPATFPKWLSNVNPDYQKFISITPFLKEAGIEFTSSNQYVTIPRFTMQEFDDYYSGSLTISFWIKYSPGSSGFIFRYHDIINNDDHISIYLEANGALSLSVQGEGGTTNPVDPFVWKAITVSMNFYNGVDGYIFAFMESSQIFDTQIAPGNFEFHPSDIVTIGGPPSFIGALSNFRIFSPGSFVVSDATTCSDNSQLSCPVLIGSPAHKTCLSNSLLSCHHSCKTCIDSTDYGCLSCANNYYFQDKKCITDDKLSSQTTTAIKASQTANRAAAQVVNALTIGSRSGISTAVGGKIFTNIKFLNISYSEQLEDALTLWSSSFISLGLTPDMPNSVQQQIPEEHVPYVFEKREVPVSFLINFWESLGMLVLASFVFFVVKGLEWVSRTMKIRYLLHAGIREYVQNFLLAQFYSAFGDILLFSILEFRSPNLTTSWSRVSFFSCLILLMIMLLLLPTHFLLIRNYQNAKSNPEALSQFVENHKGSFIVFNDFKDYSLIRQSFLFLLTARDLLFSLLFVTMFDHPLIQSIFILCLDIALLVYLILKPPFKSVFDATQQLFYEIIALAVNVCLLILAIMDERDIIGTDLRSSIGKFIIITNMIFNFGSLAFMLIKSLQTFVEIYQNYKAKRDSKEKSLKVQNIHKISPKSLDQSSKIMNSTFAHQNELKTIYNEKQDLNRSSNNQSQINSILNSYRNNEQDSSIEGQSFSFRANFAPQNQFIRVKPRIQPS